MRRATLCVAFSLGAVASPLLAASTARVNALARIVSRGVDNYNDGDSTTLNGALSGPMPDGSIVATYDTGIYNGPSGASLKLASTLSASSGWNGYWIKMAPQVLGADTPVDLSGYTHLVFFVRGALGGVEHLKIQMTNASLNAARKTSFLFVNDYLDGGITSGWSEVRIPVRAFANLDSFANVTQLEFLFDRDYATGSAFALSPTVYIDDVAFKDLSADPTAPRLRIDHFGDMDDRDALGGKIGIVGAPISAGLSFPSQDVGVGRMLRVAYDVSPGVGRTNDAGYLFHFGGGAAGYLAVPVNASPYGKLKFRARAEVGTNPGKFSFILTSNAPAGSIGDTILGLTDTWQDFEINLNGFLPAQLDKASIKSFELLFERAKVNTPTGVVYFDNIEFSN